MDGVLVCDKPAGLTSHDVVARVRRLAGQRRVGHGGTLDPPATGVLVMALGRATRLLPFLPTEPKRYLAEVAFGAETDTLDAAGTVTATAAADGVDERAPAGRHGRLPRPPGAGPADGVGDQGGRGAPVRQGPPGRGGRAGPPPDRHPRPGAARARPRGAAGGHHRGGLLGRHLRPLPGRRPRPVPWHPGPSGQPAPHGRRPVRRGGRPHPGGAGRAGASWRRPCSTRRRRWPRRRPGP